MTIWTEIKPKKVKCHHCESRFHPDMLHEVSRVGGGTYRRPPRRYSCRLCSGCIEELLLKTQEGHDLVGSSGHYRIHSLEYAAERAGLRVQKRKE